jgi:hypothetical protein
MEQAMLQLQEAAKAATEQSKQPLSRQGDDSNTAVPEGVEHSSVTPEEQKDFLLQRMSMKELRELVDSPSMQIES